MIKFGTTTIITRWKSLMTMRKLWVRWRRRCRINGGGIFAFPEKGKLLSSRSSFITTQSSKIDQCLLIPRQQQQRWHHYYTHIFRAIFKLWLEKCTSFEKLFWAFPIWHSGGAGGRLQKYLVVPFLELSLYRLYQILYMYSSFFYSLLLAKKKKNMCR